jgi:phosphoglycolate phosphatase
VTRPYELLVFDWDGTLADSAALIVSGMQEAIAVLKLPARADHRIRELIGLSFDDAVQRLYPELAFAELRAGLADYRRKLLAGGRHGGPAEAPLFEGALQSLRVLRDAGYRLALATGKSRASLERSLKRHPELRPLLSSSRCADESAAKPDPAMLRELLEVEDLPPERALMIGDTEFDVLMARSARMPALGVACGVHEQGRLLEAGALDVLRDVSGLHAWLERRTAAPDDGTRGQA